MVKLMLKNNPPLNFSLKYHLSSLDYSGYVLFDYRSPVFKFRLEIFSGKLEAYLEEFHNWVLLFKKKIEIENKFSMNFENLLFEIDSQIFIRIFYLNNKEDYLQFEVLSKEDLNKFLDDLELKIQSFLIDIEVKKPDDLIYCSISFGNNWKNYYYLTDDSSIKKRDRVVVPTGKDNIYKIALVTNVGYFSQSKIPYPVRKTKKIIRPIKFDLFDFENRENVYIKLVDGFECIVNTFEIDQDECFDGLNDICIWIEVVKVLNQGNHQVEEIDEYFNEIDILNIYQIQ